jgi:hypothetical protein
MFLVVSCGGDATAPEEESVTSDGVWGDVLEGGVEDGVVPLDVALQTFELAIGDLPDVDAPGGDTEDITSGSGAIRWTLGHREQLTSDQLHAVTGYLDSVTGEIPEGARPWPVMALQVPPSAAAEVDEVALLGLIGQIEAKLASQLGRDLGVPIELYVAPNLVEGDADAFVVGTDSSGGYFGKMTKCTLTITKAGMGTASQVEDGVPSADLESLIAHEVFHCFEAAVGTLAQSQKRPSWVVEGLAQWAGETISGGSKVSKWGAWLLEPTIPLWDRVYSAIGFYAHLDEHGADMWGLADAIIAASDQGNENAYTTAIAGASPDVVPTWGPGTYRDPTRAPAWDQDGAGIVPVKYAPQTTLPAVTAGTVIEPNTPKLTADIWDTGIDAQVVSITGEGHGMILLADGAELSFPESVGTILCTEPGGCTCPDGTPGSSAVFRITERGDIRVGLTGHLDGTTLDLRGWDLEEFCDEYEAGGCLVGVWEVVSYSSPNQEIMDGSGGGITLTVDGEGDSVLDFNDSNPIFARVLVDDAPWVRVRQVGTVHFQVDVTQDEVVVASAVGVGYHIAGDVVLGDDIFQAGPGIGLDGAGMGPGVTLDCQGDTLTWTAPGGLAQYVFDRIASDGEDVPAPPQDGEPVGGGGGEGTPGGESPPQPSELPEGANACVILSLDEVRTVFPQAGGGVTEDDISGPFYRQCTYTDGMFLSIQPPADPEFVESGAGALDTETLVIDGIGVWARAFLNEGDPTFGITAGSVFMLSAGNEKGTVNILPWIDVIEGTPEYQALLDLIELALSRL